MPILLLLPLLLLSHLGPLAVPLGVDARAGLEKSAELLLGLFLAADRPETADEVTCFRVLVAVDNVELPTQHQRKHLANRRLAAPCVRGGHGGKQKDG